MSAVLDTDILVDVLRGVPRALRTLERLRGSEEVILFSAITEAELLAGKECEDPEKEEAARVLLSPFRKVPVDNPVAAGGGKIRRVHGLGLDDCLIAATALRAGAALVTRNRRDFARVRGLRVETPY